MGFCAIRNSKVTTIISTNVFCQKALHAIHKPRVQKLKPVIHKFISFYSVEVNIPFFIIDQSYLLFSYSYSLIPQT